MPKEETFEEYVESSASQCQHLRPDPTGRLFEFTRMIKGWFMDTVTTEQALKETNAVIQSLGGWERHFELEGDAACDLFRLRWPEIRYLPDEDPLIQAWDKAKAFPLMAPDHATRLVPRPGYDRFFSLAVAMQHTRGDAPILLPTRRVADLMGTDKQVVSAWIRLMMRDGHLHRVKEHSFRSSGRSKASEYRVEPTFVDQFRGLLEKRMKGTAPKQRRGSGVPAAHVNRLLALFTDLYAKNTGSRPTWTAAHIRMLKSLLAHHGVTELEERMRFLFGRQCPGFLLEGARDLRTFITHIDKLVPTLG